MIEEAARRFSRIDILRLGEPEERADVALFLATTNATYLQGEDICVDGGYTSHLLSRGAQTLNWAISRS